MPPELADKKTSVFTLDKSTLVPIGLLISVVLASIGAATWIQGTLLELDHKIEQLNLRIAQLSDNTRDRWTVTDMKRWAELLQARNATLSVPIPSER